jgi:hypothetical protein
VQVTRFDPPLALNIWNPGPSGQVVPNVFGVDLNHDGEPDFRFLYAEGWMGAYFNFPTRVITKGSVGAVPVGTVIGSELPPKLIANRYQWSPGWTNNYDLTVAFGDRQLSAITANVIPHYIGAQPVASGEMVGKEGVIALEFSINGQTHYGYIHFDFRAPRRLENRPLSGTVGVIYGWAYETEPGVSITAEPLSSQPHKKPPVFHSPF